jgi:hypothetical protein
MAPGVNPLPETLTTVPAFTQVAWLTVTDAPPEVTVPGFGVQEAIVVVVVGMDSLDAKVKGTGVAATPLLSKAKKAQPPLWFAYCGQG